MEQWYPEALKEFKIYSVFDLLLEYIENDRIQLNNNIHTQLATYHDPCNYGRKSLKTFGHGYFEEGRTITRACCPEFIDMAPKANGNYCCGAGGGAWAMPYAAERVYYGRIKARQIQETEAKMVIAPCHNCRDQLKKSLNQEYELGIEVKYLWELVSDSLILPQAETAISDSNEQGGQEDA